jgi:hypothetical protein
MIDHARGAWSIVGDSREATSPWSGTLAGAICATGCLLIDLLKSGDFMGGYRGVGAKCEGPTMDMRRSYYLASRPDHSDVPESDDERRRMYSADIPYVTPANDNVGAKVKLSTHCRKFVRRLIDLHSLS